MTRPKPVQLYLSSALQLAVRYRVCCSSIPGDADTVFCWNPRSYHISAPVFLDLGPGMFDEQRGWSGYHSGGWFELHLVPWQILLYCKILQGIVPGKASRDLHVCSHESLASHAPEAIAARSLVVFLIFTANIESNRNSVWGFLPIVGG